MDLSTRRKSNIYINNNSNNNNLFLIIKDIYKKNNLNFICNNSKTEFKNDYDIIKNPINNVNEKNNDKKDEEGNFSYDFFIPNPSLKKTYDISNNDDSEIDSIIENYGEDEKEDGSFFNNKFIDHKRKRFPSIPNLSIMNKDE